MSPECESCHPNQTPNSTHQSKMPVMSGQMNHTDNGLAGNNTGGSRLGLAGLGRSGGGVGKAEGMGRLSVHQNTITRLFGVFCQAGHRMFGKPPSLPASWGSSNVHTLKEYMGRNNVWYHIHCLLPSPVLCGREHKQMSFLSLLPKWPHSSNNA